MAQLQMELSDHATDVKTVSVKPSLDITHIVVTIN